MEKCQYYLTYDDMQNPKKKRLTVKRSLESVSQFVSKVERAEKCRMKKEQSKRHRNQ